MKLLSRFRKSAPPPAPPVDEPGPLPPIIDRPLSWSAPFKPVMLAAGGTEVAAIPLLDEKEIAMCPFADPALVAADCAHRGLRVILLTVAGNLRGANLPMADVTRSAVIAHVLTGSPVDVDRWNSALLFMQRQVEPPHQWERTGLSGLASPKVSRLIDVAELNLHLKLVRGEIRSRS